MSLEIIESPTTRFTDLFLRHLNNGAIGAGLGSASDFLREANALINAEITAAEQKRRCEKCHKDALDAIRATQC